MDDSPLSIISSITGILTFIAAILASIYVRYHTLQNGQLELEKVIESIQSSVVETGTVATQAALGGDPASIGLHQIMVDLCEVERAILGDCMSVFGMEKPLQMGFQQAIDPTLAGEHREYAHQLASLVPDSQISLLAALFGAILRYGTTRTLMRWYMIRKDVLKKMQKRDHLRSRLLMAQISTLSS